MPVKSSQPDSSSAKYRNLNHDAPLGQAEMNAIIDAHYRLQKRIETMNRAWLESMQEARNEEIQLGRTLRECSGPSEAVAQCNAWLAMRAVNFIGYTHRMSKLWAELLLDVMPNVTSATLSRDGTKAPNDGRSRRG